MVSMRWRKEPPSPDLPDHDSSEYETPQTLLATVGDANMV